MLIHLKDSVSHRFDTDVHQYTELRVEQFAEAFEEEHVGVEFAGVLMLDAEVDVVVLLPF